MENAVTYDYKTIKIKREMETLVSDTYENLGWILTSTSAVEGSLFSVNLSFKRDRKIKNKVELLKLQEKIDNVILSIENLQNKKKNSGFIESLTVGIIGCLTFGGGLSMTMLLETVGYKVFGILLGIIGVGICAIAYPLFKKINKKKITQIQPILESEFDKLSDFCDEAVKLI